MLDAILAAKRAAVNSQKKLIPEQTLVVPKKYQHFRLQERLRGNAWTLIAECKLASPSKGVLDSGKSVAELAAIYEQNGAGALSVLTDRHFNGSMEHLQTVRKQTKMPLLRKDFIIDRYQIVESAAAGADVILLIAAALEQGEVETYLATAHSFGMDAIVEVHNQADLEKVISLKPPIIGINNRDLRTFKTDAEQTMRLLPFCPVDSLIISESGLFEQRQAQRLKEYGVRGCLAGESLVTADDIGQKVRQLALMENIELQK